MADDLTSLFDEKTRATDAMAPYMKVLRDLATECNVCVEFGARRCSSAVALLSGGAEVHTVDVEWLPKHASMVQRIVAAAGDRWHRWTASSLDHPPRECDLLMHDSLHNGDHLRAEMSLHAPLAKKFLVFHDVTTHGEVGQSATCGPAVEGVPGMMEPIDELIDSGEWSVHYHDPNGAGLLVLAR